MITCKHDNRIVVESSGKVLVDGCCIRIMEIKPSYSSF